MSSPSAASAFAGVCLASSLTVISCVTFVSVCRWQIYHSLAYGARGILYFYYTPEIHEDDDAGIPTWVGLVRDDGLADHVTEHWHQARRINSASRLQPSTHSQHRVLASFALCSAAVMRAGGACARPHADEAAVDGRRRASVRGTRTALEAAGR